MLKDSLIRRILLALIPAILLCFCSIGVVAVDDDEEITEVAEKEKEKEEEPANPVRKKGEEPMLGVGETGVLIDQRSGRVLFEQDGDKQMYPASTTKIMTALLAVEAVERGELTMETQIEITKEMLADLDPDGSNMALKEGEILSLDSLLKGLMIPSGNDAACAIAQHLGGSRVAFVDMMNARAKELGAEDTHFANPHGLHDENHYSTAEDMAKIAHAAMKLEKFRNIADIAHIKIPPTNVTEKERYYINTNGLLSTMRYTNFFYKGSTGIKTGYTSDAGNCLVASATRDGMSFIGVILGGKSVEDSHRDNAEMLDWAFENHTAITAVAKNAMTCEVRVRQGKRADTVPLVSAQAISVVVPKDTTLEELEIKPNLPESVCAPVFAEQEIGTVSVLYRGVELASGKLLASRDIERTVFWPVIALGEGLWGMVWVRIISYLLLAAILIFIVMFVTKMYNNIKIARRRRRRQG